MSPITTHILDTTHGKPAQGVSVSLEKLERNDTWLALGTSETNADGRVLDLVPNGFVTEPGVYRLVFNTGAYFRKQGMKSFYPLVSITFETSDTTHYHVPLLLNPYGYSTYRGS